MYFAKFISRNELRPKALVEGENNSYNYENLRVLYIGAGLEHDSSSKMLSYTVKELNSIFKNVFILVHDLEKTKLLNVRRRQCYI